MAAHSFSTKLQNWGDDLRLPTVLETESILKQVESLRRTPIPLQSKHLPALKRNVWYTLRRPADKSRTGMLCILPREQCCVYVSAEPKRPIPRVALLRLRVNPQFFAADVGPTVFAATMSAASRKLWIEDVILWKGAAIHEEKSFKARWELAVQWIEHYCTLDSRLISGLDVEMAAWQALEDMEADGVWDLLQDQTGYRRLLWIPVRTPPTPTPTPSLLPSSPMLTPSSTPSLRASPCPEFEEGPLVAVAIKESGPDQWSLKSADNVSLGRALIRTMTVSSALRATDGIDVRVEVKWNPIFKKWEIMALTDLGASSGYLFCKE